MNPIKAEITELAIYPNKEKTSKNEIATFKATFNHTLILYGKIVEYPKTGITIRFRANIGFTNEQIKKEIYNRILATYVINYVKEIN